MDNTVDPNCPRCGQATPQTLDHWLDCPWTALYTHDFLSEAD